MKLKAKYILKVGTIALYGVTSVAGLLSMLFEQKREELIIDEKLDKKVDKKFDERFGKEESDDDEDEEES